MSGRGLINPEDIALVRERVSIEDVVSERVTLRRVGSNLSGLCPFHDDSSPSFSVSPDKGIWTCFGCGLGGDIISFVQQAEGLPFVEAVQRLADRVGIQLRYMESDSGYVAPPPGQRVRLVAANTTANDFFMRHIMDDENEVGRGYLLERNFDYASWDQFEVGYSPNQYDGLLNHLKNLGFTQDEMVLAGLAVKNDEGRVYDRFRGRLMWPIRDLGGDIIGFGARKLFEDDKGPKWLNTPDTPLYRKSDALYGIDKARKDIAAERQVVVVEGYGDVMAAHLAGVTTAVATCGTAFGDGHIRIVRRLLRDNDQFSGRVVFTFDGDSAGQKAALRAFKDNDRFTAQTFVAVAPEGMDPCDLRIAQGNEAVRELVANAVPLVEFAIRSMINGYDITTTEGRVSAMRVTAPLVAGIKDMAMRTEYVRRLSGWLALPPATIQSAVAYAVKQGHDEARDSAHNPHDEAPVSVAGSWRPNPNDPALTGEREAAKCLLQIPVEVDSWLDELTGDMFTNKAYRGIYALALKARGLGSDAGSRVHAIRADASADEAVALFVNELAIEPLHAGAVDFGEYGDAVMRRLVDKQLERQIAVAMSQLSDSSEATQQAALSAVLSLESQRRILKTRVYVRPLIAVDEEIPF